MPLSPGPSSHRHVMLADGRSPERLLVQAVLHRDCPPHYLDAIEDEWAGARERAAEEGPAAGFEHAHWDWRNKAPSVEAGIHLLVAIECDGAPQGVMAVQRMPLRSRLSEGHVVYVDYLETAPWNLKRPGESARDLGGGTVLIAEAVRLSLEQGLDGRVGLHSLPQAEPFYAKIKMTRVGIDEDYYDLAYFEYTASQAAEWLASIGELP